MFTDEQQAAIIEAVNKYRDRVEPRTWGVELEDGHYIGSIGCMCALGAYAKDTPIPCVKMVIDVSFAEHFGVDVEVIRSFIRGFDGRPLQGYDHGPAWAFGNLVRSGL